MLNCKYLQEGVMHNVLALQSPWNTFNKFVIVYYKTLGTAFAAILKDLFCLETGVFSCKIFAVYGMENWSGWG